MILDIFSFSRIIFVSPVFTSYQLNATDFKNIPVDLYKVTRYEDNIVYVKLNGACDDCNMLDLTLKDGIESMLIEEIPEIKEVINLN